MSMKGADKSGRLRIRCTAAHESGSCPDPQSFYLDTVELRVVSTLKAEMQHPKGIAEYVKTYQEERQKLAAKQNRERASLERRLGEVDREIKRVVDHMAKGIGDEVLLGARTFVLGAEKRRLEAQLVAAPPKVVALHPTILKDYERKLDRLQEAIAEDMKDGEPDHAKAIRDLIERITVRRDPNEPAAVQIEITGRLEKLLGENVFPSRRGVGGTSGSGGGI
jgi:site-specific DNA recombinase